MTIYVDTLKIWDISETGKETDALNARAAVTSSLHETWEVASYVDVDSFEHLDQPESGLSLYSIAAKERDQVWRGFSSSALL